MATISIDVNELKILVKKCFVLNYHHYIYFKIININYI